MGHHITIRTYPPPGDWVTNPERACADLNTDAWFPAVGHGGTHSTRRAKEICNGTPVRPGCPVRVECREYAVGSERVFGIWGGTTERDRERLRALRKAAA